LNERIDLYLGVIVLAMFLAGAVLAFVYRRQRSHSRKKWDNVSGQ
jgi:cbb3-type cytochrome oxidase subunit 3